MKILTPFIYVWCSMDVKRKYINWIKTGKNLELLRNDNINLRRCTCYVLNFKKAQCSGECDNCKYEMDSNISRTELARLFNVSESVIFNWENGRTPISLEDILFYCKIAKVNLDDIIVYD
jgi:DNA-binding XRE family transcriptional regulator